MAFKTIIENDLEKNGLDCTIDDVSNKIILEEYNYNKDGYLYRNGVLKETSTVTEGSEILIPSLNRTYLVLVKEYEINQGEKIYTVTRLVKCNAVFNVSHLEKTYNEQRGRLTGTELVNDYENIKGAIYIINDKIKEEEAGILDDTEYKLIISNKYDVNLNNRVVIGSTEYKVLFIDDIKYEGSYVLQLAIDLRND